MNATQSLGEIFTHSNHYVPLRHGAYKKREDLLSIRDTYEGQHYAIFPSTRDRMNESARVFPLVPGPQGFAVKRTFSTKGTRLLTNGADAAQGLSH